MTRNEKWLPVPECPGYEVSDHGRVRSLDREVRSRWDTPKTLKGKLLSQGLVGGNEPGGRYRSCTLFRDGKRKSVMIHALVLETFVGRRPEGMNGCHRDDNPTNNHLENLYWGTQTQNVQDAVKSGRHDSAKQSAKTHCPQGHEYTEENTRVKRNGHRECRLCHCDQVKRAYRNKHGGNVRPAPADRTHCPQGHLYDEANTYRAPGSPNKRVCITCLRSRSRQRSKLR